MWEAELWGLWLGNVDVGCWCLSWAFTLCTGVTRSLTWWRHEKVFVVTNFFPRSGMNEAYTSYELASSLSKLQQIFPSTKPMKSYNRVPTSPRRNHNELFSFCPFVTRFLQRSWWENWISKLAKALASPTLILVRMAHHQQLAPCSATRQSTVWLRHSREIIMVFPVVVWSLVLFRFIFARFFPLKCGMEKISNLPAAHHSFPASAVQSVRLFCRWFYLKFTFCLPLLALISCAFFEWIQSASSSTRNLKHALSRWRVSLSAESFASARRNPIEANVNDDDEPWRIPPWKASIV